MIRENRRRTGNTFHVQKIDKEILNHHGYMIGRTGTQKVHLFKVVTDKGVDKVVHVFIAKSISLFQNPRRILNVTDH